MNSPDGLRTRLQIGSDECREASRRSGLGKSLCEQRRWTRTQTSRLGASPRDGGGRAGQIQGKSLIALDDRVDGNSPEGSGVVCKAVAGGEVG